MRDFKLPIESEKTLIEKKTDVAIYREINIDCWEREITMRIYRLLFLSRWATARQRSVFWREILSSSRSPRSLSDSSKWCSNHKSNRVNFLRKYEYYQNKCQPTQSNVNAEVSRVFGRSHGRQRNQARASITMQDLQVPRTLNEWQIWGKSVLQIASERKHSILVRLNNTCWPNDQCCTTTGKEDGIEWARPYS